MNAVPDVPSAQGSLSTDKIAVIAESVATWAIRRGSRQVPRHARRQSSRRFRQCSVLVLPMSPRPCWFGILRFARRWPRTTSDANCRQPVCSHLDFAELATLRALRLARSAGAAASTVQGLPDEVTRSRIPCHACSRARRGAIWRRISRQRPRQRVTAWRSVQLSPAELHRGRSR